MKKTKFDRKYIVGLIVLIGLTIYLSSTIRLIPGFGQTLPMTEGETPISNSATNTTQIPCDQDFLPFITRSVGDQAQYYQKQYQRCLNAFYGTPNPTIRVPTFPPYTPQPEVDHRYRRIAGAGVLAFGAPVPPGLDFTSSAWYEKTTHGEIKVIAGLAIEPGYSTENGYGAIEILAYDEYRRLTTGGGFYATPQNGGMVSIVDAVGEQLTILSEKGDLFTFDVAKRQYVTPNTSSSGAIPQHKMPEGTVIDDGLPSLSSQQFTFSHQWVQEKNGNRTTVLVGKKKDDPDQGVLVISNSKGTPTSLSDSQSYLLPKKGGSLRIVDAQNEHLVVLQNNWSSWHLFMFDMVGKKFLTDQEFTTVTLDPAVLSYEADLENHPILPTLTMSH